jgi:HD-GYP domain-containing protein (c-di-GMP phosphodiesterase class II)
MQLTKLTEEMQLAAEKSKTLYQEAINLIKYILKQAEALEPINLQNIFSITDSIINQMMLYDAEFLHLVNSADTSENYLCSHSLNVLILSIEVGLGLGYNKSRLNESSIGALFHDIKILKVSDLASQPKGLAKEEYDLIKERPFYGVELLQKIKGSSDVAIYVAKEQLERRGDSGYPRVLENGYIKEYAKLISLVEAYENLMRPYGSGKRYAPHEAIKEILSMGLKSFESKMVKALINRVGIYPVGTWVKLETGEIAKVLDLDRNLPLRPVVYIMFDKHEKRLKEPRILNLAKQYNVYIKRPLADEELEKIAKTQQERLNEAI